VQHTAVQQAKDTAARTDTAWHAQRDSVTHALRQYTVIRAHAPVPSDTVVDSIPYPDTVWLPAFVGACDSLASACRAFRDTTIRLRAIDSTVIARQDSEITALQHLVPSHASQLITRGAWATVGAGAAVLLYHVLH
jgi:hypothetical protein